MLHTHAVTTVRFEGKPLDEKVLRGVHNYFNIYMLLLTLSVLLLSLDGFDIVSTFTAVVTCFNNVGPGLEMVAPWAASQTSRPRPSCCSALTCWQDDWSCTPCWRCFRPGCGGSGFLLLKKPKFDFNSSFQDLPPCGRSFFIGCRKMAEHRKPQEKYNLVPTCIYITKPREGIPWRRNKKGKTVPQDPFVFLVLGLLAAVLAAVVHLLYHTEYAETSTPNDCFAAVSATATGETAVPKIVCLTFDDGPSAHTPEILDILEKEHVPATFFVCAQDANEAHLDKIADIAAAATRSPCTAPATSTAKSIAVPMLSGRTSSSCARPSAPMWTPIP